MSEQMIQDEALPTSFVLALALPLIVFSEVFCVPFPFPSFAPL